MRNMQTTAAPGYVPKTAQAPRCSPGDARWTPSLPANVVFAVAGNAAYALSFWAMLILAAKFTSRQMVGHLALGFSIATPAIMFASLQTRAVQVSDRVSGYRLRDFLYLRLGTNGIVAGLLAVIVAIVGGFGTAAVIIVLTICYRGIENISDVFHGVFQADDRMDRIAVSQVLRGAASVLLLALGLWFTRELSWALALAVLAPLLSLVFYDVPRAMAQKDLAFPRSAREYVDGVAPDRIMRLAGVSAPLGIAAILLSLTNNLPRYAVASIKGDTALGGFAAVIYIVVAGSLFIDSLNQSALATLSRHYTAGDIRGFTKIMAALCGISAATALLGLAGCMWFGGEALTILYRPEYSKFAGLLDWCLLGLLFQGLGSTLRTGLIAARRYRVQLPLLLVVCVVSAASAWGLTIIYGLTGAAASLIVSGATLAVASFGLLYRALKQREREAVYSL